MVQLPKQNHSIYGDFSKGDFVVQKSSHVFSTMAIDQSRDQMNEKTGDGGVIGLTENPSGLIK